jgi:glycine dehydrogenase subunit 1
VPPGECGADIVTGEGQSFGIPTSFGGPYLGFFATNKKYLRSMPGRLVGETVDRQGRRGFVLTLATREQHIRRNKATSNICSNEALCALSATIYLSLLGKVGLKKLAQLNLLRSEYAKKKISGLKGFKLKFNGPAFNEFVIESKIDPGQLNMILAKKGIIGGLPLKEFYPELNNTLLFCVTECNSREDIDRLCAALNDL